VLFEGTTVAHRPIEAVLWDLPRALPALVERESCASVVLADVTSVLLGLEELGQESAFLDGLEAPVIALDFWNLRKAGPEWDWGAGGTSIPARALEIRRRLLSVPLARPTAGPGAYNALPEVPPVAPAERRDARRELGLGPRDRLILLPTSRWQLPEVQLLKHHQRIARALPLRLASLLARLRPRPHVLHVGPVAFPLGAALGDRFRWLPAVDVSPARFRLLFGAADLLLSLNATGITTLSAVAAGVPVLAIVNSHQGRTVAEVLRALGEDGPDELRSWLSEVVPLYPFRVWPLGLLRFLAPVLADNPFTATYRTAELLDEASFLRSCRALLFEDDAAAQERQRQSSYRESLRALPTPAQAFLACL
jgi:hypothetical protein